MHIFNSNMHILIGKIADLINKWTENAQISSQHASHLNERWTQFHMMKELMVNALCRSSQQIPAQICNGTPSLTPNRSHRRWLTERPYLNPSR